MKLKPLLLALALTPAVLPAADNDTPPPNLPSAVYALDQLPVTPTPLGTRRAVFDGPTATVDKLHCHVTTLNQGERSGEPRLHHQEEIIIVKSGTVEANFDHEKRVAHAGDIIHFAANATTFLRNIGDGPATYYVIYFYPLRTSKQ
jgi:quercetin dioxygenase-like cupin family protein